MGSSAMRFCGQQVASSPGLGEHYSLVTGTSNGNKRHDDDIMLKDLKVSNLIRYKYNSERLRLVYSPETFRDYTNRTF